MSSFLKELIETKPALILSTVYFCPGKKTSLPCVIRDDGTLSPLCDESLRFESASNLIESWKAKRFFPPECSIGVNVKPTAFNFRNDIFFEKGRKRRLRSLLEEGPPTKKGQGDVEATRSILTNDPDEIESTNASMENRINDTNLNELASTNVGSLRSEGSEALHLTDMELRHGGLDEERHEFGQLENDAASPKPTIEGGQRLGSNLETMNSFDTENGGGTSSAPILERRLCPGFERSRYNELIIKRQWDNEGRNACPIRLGSNRCWSKRCYWEIVGRTSVCRECAKSKKSLQTIQKRLLDKPTNEERRIMHSENRWLSYEDQQRKVEILKRRKADVTRKMRTVVRRNGRLRNELDKYRPKYTKNRRAVRSVVAYLDRLEEKIKSPKCRWILESGEPCGYEIHSINLLSQHVHNEHLQAQLDENATKGPAEKKYRCHWTGCHRRAHFRTFDDMLKHLVGHTGNAKTETRLSVLREQLMNSDREPTGRRYSKNTKISVMRHYRSRGTWNKVRLICPLPLPSLRSMLGWKNNNNVKSGVDHDLLKSMQYVARDKPELRHGILSFDEIRVKKRLLRRQKSNLTFGEAMDDNNELATSVLVFQYLSLFSKRRFVLNVAFYPVRSLTAKTLEKWLLDVMIDLLFRGFQVHALICDGLSANRKLQMNLVQQSRIVGRLGNANYVIHHPLTTAPGARLFLLSDPSHAIKKLRNNMYNRNMAFSKDMPICFGHLQEVKEWQDRYARVERRLTKKHLDLDNFYKMSVQKAVDVFSESVENVMLEIDGSRMLGTREYMGIGRELWLAMNDSRVYYNADQAKRSLGGLQWVGERLRSWKKEAPSKDEFLTNATYYDVLLICEGVPRFMDYVWNVLSAEVPGVGFKPKVLSQDPLERTFGALRQRGGGTANITVMSLAYNLRSINCNILSAFLLGKK